MNIYALMDLQKKMIEAMFNPYLNARDSMFASMFKTNANNTHASASSFTPTKS